MHIDEERTLATLTTHRKIIDDLVSRVLGDRQGQRQQGNGRRVPEEYPQGEFKELADIILAVNPAEAP